MLKRTKKGFTAVEILVAVSILVLLSILTFRSFGNLNEEQALDKTALAVSSVLNEARSLTLSSKEASQYGAHIEADSITLFKGSTYVSGASENITTTFHKLVHISNINLTSGSDVVFERLTGEVSNTGTLTISLKNDPTNSKTVTVTNTGVIQTN